MNEGVVLLIGKCSLRFRSVKPKRSLARTQKPAEGSICDNSGLRGLSFSAQTAVSGQE